MAGDAGAATLEGRRIFRDRENIGYDLKTRSDFEDESSFVFRHLQEQREQSVGPDNREHLLSADSRAGAPFLDDLPRRLGRRLLPVATLRQGALHFLSCVNPPFANVALSFPHHLLKARIGLDPFHSFSRWRVRAYEHFCFGGRHGAVCGTSFTRTRPACFSHRYSIARPYSLYQGMVCKTLRCLRRLPS